MKRNQDLDITLTDSIDTDEHYTLYAQYIEARHSDGDMYPATREQFLSFLGAGAPSTQFFEMREGKRLVGCFLSDQLLNGPSAIYTYFDPEMEFRSLGRFAILKQIQLAQETQRPYLYLGYWIKHCAKMAYKGEYRPLELLINNEWLRLN